MTNFLSYPFRSIREDESWEDYYREKYKESNPNWPYPPPPEQKSALAQQVGGNHYKDCSIQPIEYILANNLGFCEGNIVKYITRHKKKGERKDIEKVIHYAQLLLETEYKDQ